MEDNMSWLPHSNNCLCILKHLLNHIWVTMAFNRSQKPISCLSAGLDAEPSTIPCFTMIKLTVVQNSLIVKVYTHVIYEKTKTNVSICWILVWNLNIIFFLNGYFEYLCGNHMHFFYRILLRFMHHILLVHLQWILCVSWF